MTRFFFERIKANEKQNLEEWFYQCFDYDMNANIGREIVYQQLTLWNSQRHIVMRTVHAFASLAVQICNSIIKCYT